MVLHPHPKLPFIIAMLLNTFHIPPQVAAFVSAYVVYQEPFGMKGTTISHDASSDAIFYINFLQP